VVVHHGVLDPLRAGFRKERQFVAQAAPLDRAIGPAWRVDSPMGFYYWRLTNAQKSAALTRGWRLRARLALREGNGFVDLDLAPNAGRFDLGFFGRSSATTSFLLMESSQPRKGEWLDQGPTGTMPLVEFVSDPASGTVRFLVNGRTVRSGYPGYRQFQEDFGLFFGATSDLGGVPSGQVDIALAWLAIR
jgi:hypothetical protein